MIEEHGIVVALEEGAAWVETRRQSACGTCQASEAGCGTAALGKIWSGQRTRMRVSAPIVVHPGDAVIIGLAEGALLRSALLAYLPALLLLLAGALLGRFVFADAGDEPVVLLGALGLGLGLWATRVLAQHVQHDSRFQPVILRHQAPVAETVPDAWQ